MKKLLTISLFVLFGLNTNAQTTMERAKKMTDNMAKQLALTEKQKADIYTFTLNRLNTLGELKAKTDKESEQGYLVQRRKFHSEIHQFLNDEQYKKWNHLREEQIRSKKDGKATAPADSIIDDELEFMNKG